jgi:DsbC/DsbD-like thiol-disulfide interchange protein
MFRMNKRCRLARFLPLLGAASLIAAVAPAYASDASPWDEDIRSAARLIAAHTITHADNPVYRAGVEIRMKPGWKTYWRYPGDSGVPPVFDFSNSENVRSVTVLYPAPMRFDDGAGGQSIGYKDSIILPLHIAPMDSGRPVTLRMKLDYAACEKLCVPAKASAELLLSGGASSNDAMVAAAESRVPRPGKIGEATVPAIRAVAREQGAGKPRIIVDVAVLSGAAATLFAEGPTPEWALPLPEPVASPSADVQRFAFELDGLPPGAKAAGATLRLTAVAGERAVEVAFRLD